MKELSLNLSPIEPSLIDAIKILRDPVMRPIKRETKPNNSRAKVKSARKTRLFNQRHK